MRRWSPSLLLLLLSVAPASAQGAAAPCGRADVPASAREACFVAAQALDAVQPQLGILLGGGNPTLGSVSTAGLRLGMGPGTSMTGKLSAVQARLPDLTGDGEEGELSFPVPALTGTLSLSLSPGRTLAPTVSGIGSLDLLAGISWLPFRTLGVSEFGDASAELAYAFGARLGLLRESFAVPGVSVSLMYRTLDEVQYGNVCSSPLPPYTSTQGYGFTSGACTGEGDAGEFAVDLTGWSGRAIAGKQFGPLGIAAGAGYDRYSSEVGVGFRSADGYVGRAYGMDVDSDRWTAFGNASFVSLITTVALEAGWLQGGEAVPGFPAAAGFDPGAGTLYGSLGVRLSF